MTENISKAKLKKIGECLYEYPKEGKMNVPAWLFLSEELAKNIEDGAIQQAANVSAMPGIYLHSIAMPDMHFGYGFPIGGVAALDFEKGGLSPGGIGFDINCGVRLLRTNLSYNDVKAKLPELVKSIYENVPSGLGSEGKVRLSTKQMRDVIETGSKWAIENGYGTKRDLEFTEANGCLKVSDSSMISDKALSRGAPQLGSLGAGNHFLEIQRIDKIFSPEAAKVFGLDKPDQVCIMIHTGSRGFGHQVCTEYLRILETAFRDEITKLPDRELVYAPAGTKECEEYFQAMCCAANFAWANRQLIAHWIRESFIKILKMKEQEIGLEQVYDVAHNICKVEEHDIEGKKRKVFVHRKGATRAFPPNHPEIPSAHRSVGQVVLLPGAMATASYVLHGTEEAKKTFYSTAHGAGRVMSRNEALSRFRGEKIKSEMEAKGISVKCASWKVLAEEASPVYKDIDEVARISDVAGIAKRVVRMIPIGVVKG